MYVTFIFSKLNTCIAHTSDRWPNKTSSIDCNLQISSTAVSVIVAVLRVECSLHACNGMVGLSFDRMIHFIFVKLNAKYFLKFII